MRSTRGGGLSKHACVVQPGHTQNCCPAASAVARGLLVVCSGLPCALAPQPLPSGGRRKNTAPVTATAELRDASPACSAACGREVVLAALAAAASCLGLPPWGTLAPSLSVWCLRGERARDACVCVCVCLLLRIFPFVLSFQQCDYEVARQEFPWVYPVWVSMTLNL